MLIYNNKKEFTGVDEQTLRKIGYNTINELNQDVSDFADLFDNRPGLVHNYKNFSWVDFLLHTDKENVTANIRCNSKIYSCGFRVEAFYFAHLDEPDNLGYAVNLTDLHIIGDDDGSELREVQPQVDLTAGFTPPISVQAAPKEPSPFEKAVAVEPAIQESLYEPESPVAVEQETLVPALEMQIDEPEEEVEIQEVVQSATPNVSIPSTYRGSIVLETPSDYVFDPSVAADELGLPSDLIDEFVGDFIQQAEKFQPEILEALKQEDFDTIQILSHKLKGVAANLRIEDALEVLTFVNSSRDAILLRDYLDLFTSIMHKLSGVTVEATVEATAEEGSLEDITTNSLDDDEDMYSFDLMDSAETLPDLALEEEVTTQESINEPAFELQAEPEEQEPEDELQEYINEFIEHANFLKPDFEEALKTQDFQEIRTIASTLKGMCESLELTELADMLEAIQTTDDINEAINSAKDVFVAIRAL